jgi:hypothetical protein
MRTGWHQLSDGLPGSGPTSAAVAAPGRRGRAHRASSSTFTRRDLLQQLAGQLPDGAPVDYVEQAADAILNHDTDLLVALGPTRGHLTSVDVIRRGDGRVVPVDPDERRYTTKGLLLTEQRAINRASPRTESQTRG